MVKISCGYNSGHDLDISKDIDILTRRCIYRQYLEENVVRNRHHIRSGNKCITFKRED